MNKSVSLLTELVNTAHTIAQDGKTTSSSGKTTKAGITPKHDAPFKDSRGRWHDTNGRLMSNARAEELGLTGEAAGAKAKATDKEIKQTERRQRRLQKIDRRGGALGERRERFQRGAAAGVAIGITQGLSTYSSMKNKDGELASKDARIAGGIVTGLGTAMGTALVNAIPGIGPVLGPMIGPLIGQAFNKWVAPALGNIIDQQAIARRERSKEAEKTYTSIKSIQNDTKTLKELSSSGNILSFEQYQKASSAIENIVTELYNNPKAARILAGKIDTLGTLGENATDRQVIDFVEQQLRGSLAGSADSRQALIQNWDLALSEVLSESYIAKNEDTQYKQNKLLNTDSIKVTSNKVKEAIRNFQGDHQGDLKLDGNNLLFYGSTDERQNTARLLLSYLEGEGLDTETFYKRLGTQVKNIDDAISGSRTRGKEQNQNLISQIANMSINNNDKGLSFNNMSLAQLKQMGTTEAARIFVEYMNDLGGVWDSKGNSRTKYAWTGSIDTLASPMQDLVRQFFNSSELLRSAFTKEAYTLGEAQNLLSDKEFNEYVENFAERLNISIAELTANLDKYKDFSLEEISQDVSGLKEGIETLNGVFSSMVSNTGLTISNLETLFSKFPELVQFAGNTTELAKAMWNKTSEYQKLLIAELTEDLGKNEKIFTSWKNSLTEVERNTINTINSLKNALNANDFWTAYLHLPEDQKTEDLQKIAEQFANTFNNFGSSVTHSTVELDAMRSHLSKIYEMQINNLQSQKQALEQINSQREYENKLIEARNKLENAQNEKQRVYREGVGFVYEADQEAVQQAQEELDKLKREKEADELDMAIAELQLGKDWLDQMPDREQWKNMSATFKGIFKEMDPLNKNLSNLGTLADELIKHYDQNWDTNSYTGAVGDLDKKNEKKLRSSFESNFNQVSQWETVRDQLERFANKGDAQGAVNYLQSVANNDNKTWDSNVATAAGNILSDYGLSEDNSGSFLTDYGKIKQTVGETMRTAASNANTAARDIVKTWGADGDDNLDYWAGNKESKITGNSVYQDYLEKNEERSRMPAGLLDVEAERAFKGVVDKLKQNEYGGFVQVGDNLLYQTSSPDAWDKQLPEAIFDYFHNPNDFGFFEQVTKEVLKDDGVWSALRNKVHEQGSPNGNALTLSDAEYNSLSSEDLARLSGDYVFTKTKNGWKMTMRGMYYHPDKIYLDKLRYEIRSLMKNPKAIPTSSNYLGSLSTLGGLSTISEFGPELFATPGLSGTALIPEGSKVLPAEATKGLWEFGNFASEFIKPLRSLMSGFSGGDSTIFGNDESTNINTLNITLRADKDFDAEKFIQQLKMLQAISKNNA